MDTPKAQLVPDRLAVPADEVAKLLGISRAQVWKLLSAGKLPLPVRLGTKAPRWRVHELRAWLDAGAPDRQTWLKSQGGQR